LRVIRAAAWVLCDTRLGVYSDTQERLNQAAPSPVASGKRVRVWVALGRFLG